MKIGVDRFSLQHTLDSGQFFRYQKIHDWYHCQERDKHFKIRQELSKDKTLLPAIKQYLGLRLMERDPWETLVSFQCSIFSNIKKIKLNMNCLAKEFGVNKGHYTFPGPGKLNNLDKIKKCATGFRAKYIFSANTMVDDAYFEKLKKQKYEDAKKELMELPGVAEKVADCICLFALGKMEAFPVDVWIETIMTKHYFDGKKTKHKELRA